MYFANMYCYGEDQTMVGITGIRGCMGVIYVGAGSMYAIHIPDNGRDMNMQAGKQFVTWVKNQGQAVGKGHGHLFGFANGINRSFSTANYSSAEEEVRAIKKGLNAPPTLLYRIMKHLGVNSGKDSADSAAIMLERVHSTGANPSGCAIWYKRNDDIKWVGGGARETAQYKVDPRYQGDGVPSDLNAHWWRMSGDNCNIIKI